MKKIVVLGSLNMDMVMTTERLPMIGETICSDQIHYMVGGKGSNQAVAVSRMGISTSLLGCVGNDAFGERIQKHLSRETLDISSLNIIEDTPTGIATVFKTKNNNAIVVNSGANDCCDRRIVEENIEIIKQADVLLAQLEIPIETVEYALQKAKEFGVTTILNPAPYKEIPIGLIEYVDYITPNDTEFESMMSGELGSSGDLETDMLEWSKQNSVKLIVTRSSQGSSYVENGQVTTIPCINVDVVDTTGAGDTFNGILAYAIAEKMELRDAVRIAGIGASLSIRALGAQSGMPSIKELKKYL
ncbi:ribokinase [Paenibacillus sp. FSL K6-2859]|uniref:ribokinase n=1 Tax=Paenibacillus sp. FSL K6-2859 TaxID=2921482 RepID=UPI0030F60782